MREENGFSLVEVLVAAVLFSLVMVGLSSVFIAGNKLMIHSRERMVSAQLGKLFLDPLQKYVRQDTWDDSSRNGLVVIASSPIISEIINNRTFDECHEVSAVSSTLRRVISKISWTEPSS